jgi:hypothetical protein
MAAGAHCRGVCMCVRGGGLMRGNGKGGRWGGLFAYQGKEVNYDQWLLERIAKLWMGLRA